MKQFFLCCLMVAAAIAVKAQPFYTVNTFQIPCGNFNVETYVIETGVPGTQYRLADVPFNVGVSPVVLNLALPTSWYSGSVPTGTTGNFDFYTSTVTTDCNPQQSGTGSNGGILDQVIIGDPTITPYNAAEALERSCGTCPAPYSGPIINVYYPNPGGNLILMID